jgi:hypothetical protein
MATTTAIILIGHVHQNHCRINPKHLMRFTENERPTLLLQQLEGNKELKVIIPTVENIIDDIYWMVAVFILNCITPPKEIHNLKRNSLDEILDDKERFSLYNETKKILEKKTLYWY